MGKTTVEIDEGLISEALKVSRLKTKKDVIERGLREIIRIENRNLLRQELGTFDLDLTLEELMTKRAKG